MSGTSQQSESSSDHARGLDETSQEFVGRWQRLVSNTNWEKGRIILQWRQALVDAGVPASEYSDDAWARRLTNVSPQHVGRLRRTFERFAETYAGYEGLYWSHFQATLDWNDAEMWLERCKMAGRSPRCGPSAQPDPRHSVGGLRGRCQIPHEEFDDDGSLDDRAGATEAREKVDLSDDHDGIAAAGNDEATDSITDVDHGESDRYEGEPFAEERPEESAPFASLPTLPDDLADACETFKLAILRHKLAGWMEVLRDDVLTTLVRCERWSWPTVPIKFRD